MRRRFDLEQGNYYEKHLACVARLGWQMCSHCFTPAIPWILRPDDAVAQNRPWRSVMCGERQGMMHFHSVSASTAAVDLLGTFASVMAVSWNLLIMIRCLRMGDSGEYNYFTLSSVPVHASNPTCSTRLAASCTNTLHSRRTLQAYTPESRVGCNCYRITQRKVSHEVLRFFPFLKWGLVTWAIPRGKYVQRRMRSTKTKVRGTDGKRGGTFTEQERCRCR